MDLLCERGAVVAHGGDGDGGETPEQRELNRQMRDTTPPPGWEM